MNERIAKLYDQAIVVKDGGDFVTGELDPEKFAELIVRECLDVIESKRSSGENTDSWTITRDMSFHDMKQDLKEHFGVEE